MKQYGIWFGILAKRILKKPTFLLMLFAILAGSLLLSGQKQSKTSDAVIGIVQADEIWQRLQEQDGILNYQLYEKEEQLIAAVTKGEVDCGFVLPDNLIESVVQKDWQDLITVYTSSGSRMTAFAKEQIAGCIFSFYAEESYVNYINETDAFQKAEEQGILKEEIVQFANEAYLSHLVDGSTFSFVYQDERIANAQYLDEHISNPQYQDSMQADLEKKREQDLQKFPVRGILAVCIFVSGLCGLLTDWQDRKEKRFVRLVSPWMTTAVNVWIPTFFTSLASLAALYLTGEAGAFAKELFGLLFYQFLIVCYCSIIRIGLRKQETIAAAIPILTLASMICAPVYLRLALYLPVFRVVEKLFPTTFYLLFF